MRGKKILAGFLCGILTAALLPASAAAMAPGVTALHEWTWEEMVGQRTLSVYDAYAVFTRSSDDAEQLVRQDGQVMVPYGVYDAFYPIRCTGAYREQSAVRFLVRKDGQYGVIRPDGSVVLPLGAYDDIVQDGIRENMVALKAEGDQYRVWMLNREGDPIADLGLSESNSVQVYGALDRIYIQNGEMLSAWDGAGTLCWQKKGYQHEPYGGIAAYFNGVSKVYSVKEKDWHLIDRDGNFYAKQLEDTGREVEVLVNGNLLVDHKEIWNRSGKRLRTVTDGDPESAAYIDELGFLNISHGKTDTYSLLNWELEPVLENKDSITYCGGGLYEVQEGTEISFCNAAGENIPYEKMGQHDQINEIVTEMRSVPYAIGRYFIAYSQSGPNDPMMIRIVDARGNILLNENEVSNWNGLSAQNVLWAQNREGDLVTYQLPAAAPDPIYAALMEPLFSTAKNPDQPESPVETGFSDVPADAWYAGAVDWAVQEKIAAGTSATTFSPDATCTTAEILTFLWRAHGAPSPAIENPYSDLAEDSWYADAALWAYEQGLVSGTVLRGEAPCTRAATVTYLWKLSGSPVTGAASFSDVPAEAEHAQAVAWAVEKGITSGAGGNRFSPDETCTRSQIITFLYRDQMD